MENLINWKELSRRLAGNETSITRNRIPKKYQQKVDDLISAIEGVGIPKNKIDDNVEYNRSRHYSTHPTKAQTLPVPIVGYTLCVPSMGIF